MNRIVFTSLIGVCCLLQSIPLKADGPDYELRNPAVTSLDENDYNLLLRPLKLEANEKNTILTFYHLCKTDEERIEVANDETVIMDPRTGVQYMLRGIIGCDAKPNCKNIVRGMKGKVLKFQLVFPPLPRYMQRICLYGLPDLYTDKYSQYQKHFYTLTDLQEMKQFDEKREEPTLLSLVSHFTGKPGIKVGWYSKELPPKQKPKLCLEPAEYDVTQVETWPHYKNPLRIRPYFTEEPTIKYAAWFTAEATYIAYIDCRIANASSRYYFPRDSYIQADGGEQLKLVSAEGYPTNTFFYLDGTVGDCIAFILKYPPVPLTTQNVTILIDYTKAATLPVSELLANQYFVQPYQSNIVR
ncbi:MAG: hypothetical protein J5770_03725 [Bacteroidaceae bacterium]|nr:hypothetical protein [Bacteroidaceae bacterium]